MRRDALASNHLAQYPNWPCAEVECMDPVYAEDSDPDLFNMGVGHIFFAFGIVGFEGIRLLAGHIWSQRAHIGSFLADWYFVVGMVLCLTAAVIGVTIAMVR